MKTLKKNLIYIFIIALFFLAFPVLASEIDGTILNNPGYAWGENLGWINFGCSNCNLHVTDTKVTGYAWSRQYGWINFSPTFNAPGVGVNNNDDGELSGRAWSKALGWINFEGVTIDATSKFTGSTAFNTGTKAGRIYFDCAGCNVKTDWVLPALRDYSPEVTIHSIIDNIMDTIVADFTITNEGSVPIEYSVDRCVVFYTDPNNECDGIDDVYFVHGSKQLNPGQSWTPVLEEDRSVQVTVAGHYYYKLRVSYGSFFSTAAFPFWAVSSGGGNNNSGGGGGSGTTVDACPNIVGNQFSIPVGYEKINGQCVLIKKDNYDTADLNRDHSVGSIDFSILLYFWKKNPPFANLYVDINKDFKVDSIDFSIMLSQWGRKTI